MKAKKNTYRKTVSTFSVGAPGFEPGTPCSQSRCATGLRYAPKIPAVEEGFEPSVPLPVRQFSKLVV